MPGLYANKFTIEINDVVRIVFVDERMPIGGLPMAKATAAEIVMTHSNFALLISTGSDLVKKTGLGK